MTLIKVCGVTLPDDAAAVANAGVDFIGFNFWPKSKRYLSPDRAPLLAGVVRGTGPAKLVGLFVNASADEISAVCARVELDVIQLHGDETVDDCRRISTAVYRPVWKALPISGPNDIEGLDGWPVDAVLLDAPSANRGGSGKQFDHTVAQQARARFPNVKVVLAGGLDPGNVAAAIGAVRPWAVDVASGVEAAPGVKDRVKVAAFVAAVRGGS
ncbi:MAG: phosphoribosylanthranilate isomerase [Kofleriaceae bacterium]